MRSFIDKINPAEPSARYRTRYYTIITLQYAYCAQHGMQQFVHYVFFLVFSFS